MTPKSSVPKATLLWLFFSLKCLGSVSWLAAAGYANCDNLFCCLLVVPICCISICALTLSWGVYGPSFRHSAEYAAGSWVQLGRWGRVQDEWWWSWWGLGKQWHHVGCLQTSWLCINERTWMVSRVTAALFTYAPSTPCPYKTQRVLTCLFS